MKKTLSILAMAILVGCFNGTSGSVPAASGNTAAVGTSISQSSLTQMTIAQTAALPSAIILNAEEFVEKLKAEGIEIVRTVSYTEETDANNLLGRPNQYTSKVNFALKKDEVFEGEDPENTIEVFEKEADALARKKYVEGVSKNLSFATQYIYHNGVYVLRIDNQTTPKEARRIEEVFLRITR